MVSSVQMLFHTLSLKWKMQQLGWEPVFSTLLCKQSGSCNKHCMGRLPFAYTAKKHTTWCTAVFHVGANSVLLGLKLASLVGCTALGEQASKTCFGLDSMSEGK